MSNVYPTLPRLTVRDSFDDDDLTDIEDEVFIRDGKSGGILKFSDDSGVKRPLMAPRRKPKGTGNYDTPKLPLKVLLVPVCYGVMALVFLVGIVLLCIVTVNIFPVPFTMLKNLLPNSNTKSVLNSTEILPCTSLSTTVVWMRTLPKLTSEAPLRSLDVDGDGIDDILVGFSTGLDALDAAPAFICNLYFGGQSPCLGGVMALNGKTGETLWTHWTNHAIFSIDCALDITNDKTKDCIITGRGGILHAIDGKDGSMLWGVTAKELVMDKEIMLNVYDAKFITDIDGDGVGDVVVSHTTQSGRLRSSEIIMLSGKTGIVLNSIDFSKKEQLFIAPQSLVHPDGENIYLLSSSTPNLSGGLYIILQSDLLSGTMKLRTLQHGVGKGVLLQPILVDITADGTEDIIVCSLDSTIVAYNGLTFAQIWNYTVANSEIISIPIPGYYNDDKVPDIMVKHQVGPGYPVYYFSLSTILDGKTGEPILDKSIKDSGNGQMSGLTLSVEGTGNDWYLYWSANCLEHNNIDEKYRFLKGHTLLSQSRANLCKLRFNTTLSTKLLAMSQHIGPPGQSIYYSEDWKAVELNNSIDARKETEKYLNMAPTNLDLNNPILNGPVVSQRSPKFDNSAFNDRINPENSQVLDEQGDYFIQKNNEKKDSEPYEEFNNVAETKVSNNDFPAESDWTNANAWDNIRMDKQYDVPYGRDDDLETAIRLEELQRREKLIDSRRKKREDNGNYQDDGEKAVQRQPPTGILLPSITPTPNKVSMDLIFSTYWLPPSEVSLVLLAQDLDCIRRREDKIIGAIESYERESIIAECLAERGINYNLYKEGIDRENFKFALGQMTVYRMKLECVCPDDMLPGQSCRNISRHQSWSAHLGNVGDGYFRP